MSDRLPPLTALRAFEAAARHMSFAKAAEELNVTPAALSFQIKSLEEHLGQPVFRRLNRAVELTEAGRHLAPGTSDGFDALTQAWRTTRRLGETRSLTITAGPAFTAKWLSPRLFNFVSAHPEIELRFSATLKLVDLDRDPVDVAIRFSEAEEIDLFSHPVFDDWVTPMMSPALAERVTGPESLRDLPLLHQDDIDFLTHPVDWPAWFRAEDLGHAPMGGPRFSQADHAIDAAVSGLGVVLARASLTGSDVAAGRLKAPFPLALRSSARYRFLCQKGAETRPQIAAFLDWVQSEAGHCEALERGRKFVDAASIPRS
ncbi:transcriptional regulator GcvA [Tropicimonas sp. TH_r6]|uniref:transcriptional regulator GcvA n=1 Tax=Tropicimonas sp. TH_r6 TaxID=3082085 RepID=UPI002954FDF9|nr:transcriptional regulator GcvA [Tropicimonas sp. TH_r6]MDV7141343.1 transcriptional regulator GcvA [Tropicimonas sp. TH_r6]